MQVSFYGYTKYVKSLRQGQLILAQAKREAANGDIDAWFHAGCPIGPAYKKWATKKNPAPVARLPIGKKTKVNWIRQNRNGSITVSVAARGIAKQNPTASDTAIRKWHDISVGFWKSLTDRQRGQLRMEYHAGVKKGRK